MNPFSGAVSAASSTLAYLSHLLAPVGGAAAAIVAVTVLVRLAVHPLTRAAVRGERARARLAPRVAALRRQHGGDMTRFGQEMTDLYRAEGVSPFAGIGPMLAQAPVFLLLYRVCYRSGGALHHATLAGVPLTDRFVTTAVVLGPHVLVFVVLFAALAAVAVVTARRAAMVARINAATGTGTTTAPPPGAAAMRALSRTAPFFVLVSAAVVPLAAGLYLLTSTAWTAAENALLRRGLP